VGETKRETRRERVIEKESLREGEKERGGFNASAKREG